MPKQKQKQRPSNPPPLYKLPPPAPERDVHVASTSSRQETSKQPEVLAPNNASPEGPHFALHDDGTIQNSEPPPPPSSTLNSPSSTPIPSLLLSTDHPFLRLYHGNSLELLDAIAAKYGDAGRFDAIFADPPYFLSNGGITCHAGRMVQVHKGDWDKSQGPELNHEFNLEWLRRCQRVLKPNGTLWVSGTHHVIFSIGYAMQQLGYKILNDIAWEKLNPPPNLSCRYFTHSTETILWAAKNEHSKHTFNYQTMRKVTGKQMKTVWRDLKVGTSRCDVPGGIPAGILRPLGPEHRPSNRRRSHGRTSIWAERRRRSRRYGGLGIGGVRKIWGFEGFWRKICDVNRYKSNDSVINPENG